MSPHGMGWIFVSAPHSGGGVKAPHVLRGHLRGREVPPKCVCGAEVGGVGLVGPSRTRDGAPHVEIWGDPFFTEKSPKGSRDAPPK